MSGEWIDVGASGEAAAHQPLTAEVDDLAILVLRCEDGLYAVENRCTHDGEPLYGAPVEGCTIICPRHFSQFCMRTGEALSPPAYEPLRTFEVREENGRILVRLAQ
jgi:3-phenylpropionate/trans-cinnamate dioxygenase ferredoxin subunit